jgi:L-threonylcarbamoyladenylate synthase
MKRYDLSESIQALENGEVIVYPTDTLYGLGADIFNRNAVKKIFKIKKRPYSNPLSVAVASYHEIGKIAYTNAMIEKIFKRFLPGPLTILLKKKDIVPNIVTGGLENIAVRIPKNAIALDLLTQFGPLTATSANIHGIKTSHVINEIKMQFSDTISKYIDNGRLDGNPSTIVDLTSKKPSILRHGKIKKKDILETILYG